MYVRVTAAPNGTYFTLEKGMMGEPVKKLQQALKSAGYYSGICAAPTLLARWGLLTDKKAVCYPGLEAQLTGAIPQQGVSLVQDGKAGPATQRYLYEGDFPDQA